MLWHAAGKDTFQFSRKEKIQYIFPHTYIENNCKVFVEETISFCSCKYNILYTEIPVKNSK